MAPLHQGFLPQKITQLAHQLGFDLVGFAPPKLEEKYVRRWQHWLEAHCHGTMKYMENPLRAGIWGIYPWANTVISLGMFYYTDPPPQFSSPMAGRVSVYAQGSLDYHHYIRERLEQLAQEIQKQTGAQCEVMCDSFPILEKAYGEMAGLGWIGKNTCLIREKQGSFFFLGEVVTSLKLPFSSPVPNRCGSCTACIDACPTGALQPYFLDANKCISYLTIEFRGVIPKELAEKMENWIFGCDICQEVCPWNRKRQYTRHQVFQPREISWSLQDLARLWEGGFRKFFANTPILRARRSGFLRNLIVAMDNSGLDWSEFFLKAKSDPHPLVRKQVEELEKGKRDGSQTSAISPSHPTGRSSRD